jgi:hypothetical protein
MRHPFCGDDGGARDVRDDDDDVLVQPFLLKFFNYYFRV